MRSLRALVMAVLTLILLAAPYGVGAQSAGEEAATPAGPLALEPDGVLPLAGTPWRLRGYRFKGIERQPGPEVAARMMLADGRLQASGGCTAFGGSYGAVGAAISFALKRLKENTCAEQTTIVQLGMVDGLRRAASYEIEPAPDGDDALVLRAADGLEVLRFGLDEIGSLDAAEWRLAAYTTDGLRTPAVPDQASVLSFRAARTNKARRQSRGRLSASSGCNAIVGDYHRHADVMSFGVLDRTEAPCSPAAQAQEEAIVAVLDATTIRQELSPDRLRLTSVDDGDTLEFVSSQPLEGSTWLLTKPARIAGPGETVTLWLDGGVASGEGPCGAFSASYVTDGLFLSFKDVAGAGDRGCAKRAAEKALMGALRATVSLDREQPQLRLLDTRGRILARFAAVGGP